MNGRAILPVLSWLAMAGQAAALSCLAPDAARSFAEAEQAEQSYIVVTGRFAFAADDLPEGRNDADQPPVSIAARFTGHGLTADGFTTPLSMPVTLAVSCAGPWCGAVAPDVPYLAFLERRTGGYALNVGPCPQWALQDPAPGVLTRMTACINGKACGDAP